VYLFICFTGNAELKLYDFTQIV